MAQTETTRQIRIKSRVDESSVWASSNPVLLEREIGYEKDTGKYKIGDGKTAWNGLEYVPIYNINEVNKKINDEAVAKINELNIKNGIGEGSLQQENCEATGNYSFAEGFNIKAYGDYQHVQGKFNQPDNSSLFIIGNGENESNRSNALMVDKAGNVKIAGELQNMNGFSLFPFVEKEIIIPAYNVNNDNGNYNQWNTATDTLNKFVYLEIPFSSETLKYYDFRIPPIVMPYTNSETGKPLEFSESLNSLSFYSGGINAQNNYEIRIEFDYWDTNKYTNIVYNYETTWKILFWRKK